MTLHLSALVHIISIYAYYYYSFVMLAVNNTFINITFIIVKKHLLYI